MKSPDSYHTGLRALSLGVGLTAVLTACSQEAPDAPPFVSASPYMPSKSPVTGCRLPDTAHIGDSVNAAAAFEYLTDTRDYTPQGASAIVGTTEYESGTNPMAATYSNRARGIIGWNTDGFWVSLEAFAEETERNVNDLPTQLDFISYHMEELERQEALVAIENADDVAAATRTFIDSYIMPGVACYEQRIAFSEAVFDAFGSQPAA